MSTQNISCLEAKNAGFAYTEGKPVFSDISLAIAPGEVLCILGPNAAGKTSLLNCLANLRPVSSGGIYINGRDIGGLSPKEVARNVGYVPQTILPSFDFAVIDYVVTGCAPRMGTFEKPKKEHYDAALEAIVDMGIEYLAEKSYMHISGGERQQAAIARVLAQKPKFIIMDEPTAHLDYGNQIKVLMIIKRLASQGFGVLLTTHDPDHALLLGGKIAVLDRNGELSFGEGNDILTEDTLSSLYAMPLKLIYEEQVKRKICVAPRLEDMYK